MADAEARRATVLGEEEHAVATARTALQRAQARLVTRLRDVDAQLDLAHATLAGAKQAGAELEERVVDEGVSPLRVEGVYQLLQLLGVRTVSNCNSRPIFQNGAKSGFEMCFGPSTLGAGAKTRLESRIKKFTPHCVSGTDCLAGRA